MTTSEQTLDEGDLEALKEAQLRLENPGFAVKMTDYIGMPIEKGLDMLPDNWNQNVQDVTRKALMKAFDAALLTLRDQPGATASIFRHKLGAALSGGVGGFFGLGAIAVELPVSTTIMLRSIADIARSEGESLREMDTKLACLEVFALGGKSESDDSAELGYFAVRAALAKSVSESAAFILQKGVSAESAPILVKLIAKVAERFGVQVTQKAAAQSIPALGAIGGSAINTLFIDHFQDMARGHFVVRRLERRYGKMPVERAYMELASQTS